MMETEISEEQVALYDRQIRVWGMEAQQRLGKLHVLVVGCGGISGEVCKNLALAGIRKISLLDANTVLSKDVDSCFLLKSSDIGSNIATALCKPLQLLNPAVQIDALDSVHHKALLNHSLDEQLLADIDCILVGRTLPLPLELYLDLTCRSLDKSFIGCGSAGRLAWFFSDLNGGVLRYRVKEELLEQSFCSLEDSLGVERPVFRSRGLRRMLGRLEAVREFKTGMGLSREYRWGEELAEVCCVVGGLVAQEIIKAVVRDCPALKNWVLFDAQEFRAVALDVGPECSEDVSSVHVEL